MEPPMPSDTVRYPSSDGARRSDRAVVGVIGWGVPGELVEAFGATMVRVHPRIGQPTPHADALVGTGEAPETRALLEPVLDGSLSHCRMIVVTRAYEWLYYFLKEAVRTGASAQQPIPHLHLHDLVASSEASLQTYNSQQFARLVEALERQCGTDRGALSWESAIEAGNARRAALRKIATMRRAGELAGTVAVRLAAAAATQEAHAFAKEFESFEPDRPAPGAARLLLLSGDDDHDGKVHEAIEAAGAVVVAEDGEWGIRTAREDIAGGDGPLEALMAETLDSATGPWVSPRERRTGWALGALERGDLDGVVFAVPASDSRFGWDYPLLRDRAAGLGLPQLLLQVDAREDPAAATAAVAAFLSGIDGEIGG